MILIAIAWIPVVKGAHSLYEYLQSIQGYLAPPIFVVFFFGVFFKRLNAKGCFWAMVVGFILGLFRMLVDTPVTLAIWGKDASGVAVGYTEGSFFWIVNHIFFQYFSILITIVSIVVMVGRQLYDQGPHVRTYQGLDLRHRHGGRQTRHPRKLARRRPDYLGHRAGLHYRCLYISPAKNCLG